MSATQVATPSEASVAAPIPPEQLSEILYPEMTDDTFRIGERQFRLQVLPWKWEREFRKYALPMMEHEMKPYEDALVAILTEQHLLTGQLGITKSILKEDIDADEYLTKAVMVLCIAQDQIVVEAVAFRKELTLAQVQELEAKYRFMIEYETASMGPSPRAALREIVRRQQAKQKAVDALGESLHARFKEFASLAGMKDFDLRSLMRASIPRALNNSANGSTNATTEDKSRGSSTESSSASTSQTSAPAEKK